MGETIYIRSKSPPFLLIFHDPKHKFHSKPLTITCEQCRSRTHKTISYVQSNKVSDTTVTWIHNEGVVVAVGPQDTATKSPITVRGTDGASVIGLARRGAQTARPSRVTYELEQRAGRTHLSITGQASARGKTETFPC